MNKYRCPKCKKTVKRNSDAPRIKSFCESKGKTVYLVKQ